MADEPPPDGEGGLDSQATWLERAGELPPTPSRWPVPLVTAAASVVCALVAGLELGGTGVVAGLAAGLLVLVFFAAGSLPLLLSRGLGDDTGVGLVLLLTNYAFRVVVALLLLAVLVDRGWADRGALGVSVIVCALVRVNTQVLVLRGNR